MSECNIVHFSVSGEFITNQARELWAEGRYSFAVNDFLCNSLPGLTEDQAVNIITCKKKLVGINDLDLVPDDVIPEIFGISLTTENIWEVLCKRYRVMNADVSVLQRRIGLLARQQSPRMSAYKIGRGRDYFSLANDIKTYKREISRLQETLNDMVFIGRLCGKTFKDMPITFDVYPAGFDEKEYGYNKIPIESILEKYGESEQRETSIDEDETIELIDSFIQAQKEIDKKLSDKIVPNPIEDLNDASWIAPNGDHYGINGMIANMLHANMAEKLVSDGVVVIEALPDREEFPDTYLRREGWITIHNGWVLYDGYFHGKNITEEQKHSLYVFGQHYTMKTRKLPLYGIQRTPVTGVRIKMMDNIAIKKLFDLT